jgi:ribosomal protein S27AE
MLKYEDFPKKCIKCKRSDVPLEKFQFGYRKTLSHSISSSRRGFHEEKTYSIRVPVCKKCKKQLKAFFILRYLFRVFILLSLFTLFISVLFTIVPPHVKFPINILPFISTFIPTVILGIIVGMYPHKIRNYIELTESGPIIKDPHYKKEVEDYKRVRVVEDKLDINKIACPNCGALMREDADFCLSCGKDLRNIK